MTYTSDLGRRDLRWVVLLAAVSLGVRASALCVDTPDVALRFDEKQGHLVSLLDKHAGHDPVAADALGRLCVVELPQQAGGALLPEHVRQFEYQHEDNDPLRLHLSWSGFRRDAMPALSVSVRVRYDPGSAGQPYRYQVKAIRSLGDLTRRDAAKPKAGAQFGKIEPLKFSLTQRPSWMSINADTGQITGTSDGTGGTVTVSVTLMKEHRLVHDKDNIVWGNEYEQSKTYERVGPVIEQFVVDGTKDK